jgi:hypothetical protein
MLLGWSTDWGGEHRVQTGLENLHWDWDRARGKCCDDAYRRWFNPLVPQRATECRLWCGPPDLRVQVSERVSRKRVREHVIRFVLRGNDHQIHPADRALAKRLRIDLGTRLPRPGRPPRSLPRRTPNSRP